MCGTEGVRRLNDLPKLVHDLVRVKLIANKDAVKTVVDATKIAFSDVISNIARTKIVKKTDKKTKKIVETSVNIHLQRPSGSPLVLFEAEREFLASKEKCWDTLKELSDDYAKGVEFSKIEKVREAYKNAYNETFTVMQGLNSWRANRSTCLNALAKASLESKKPVEYTNAMKDAMMAYVDADFRVKYDDRNTDVDNAILQLKCFHLMKGVTTEILNENHQIDIKLIRRVSIGKRFDGLDKVRGTDKFEINMKYSKIFGTAMEDGMYKIEEYEKKFPIVQNRTGKGGDNDSLPEPDAE